MGTGGRWRRFGRDDRALVRSDERTLLFFLVLLSLAALVVSLYYVAYVIGGLPQVLPDDPPPSTAVTGLWVVGSNL